MISLRLLRPLAIASPIARSFAQTRPRRPDPRRFSPPRGPPSGMDAPLVWGFSFTGFLGGLVGLGTDHKGEEDEDFNQLINNIKLGILAQQKGDLDKAEMMLHIALKQAQDINSYDGITYVFTVLANVAFERGDYMKAEKLYKDVMKRILTKGTPQEANSMIEMSLKLARVYASWQQYEKAVLGFKFCSDTQEKKIKTGDTDDDTVALWGMSRDWFAQYLLDRGDYSAAFTQFQGAFLTSCELFGDSHTQSLVILNSMGTVASLMDDNTKAVSYFSKAVRLATTEEDENLPTYLVNLGMARIKQNMKREALGACTRAQAMGQRSGNREIVEESQHCLDLADQLHK
eukprot:maker-scaffold373_size192110-snap-gene-0.34 protein:Tk03501 transcript:maker-scaffold373_size192110-snap-gene-0.34-mRNA-1 annotation:"tetratricopeptide repeat"